MPTSRRDFLKSSSLTLAGAALASAPAVHAAGSNIIKVGLIGCGGRGTGAASQAMTAGDDVRLTALGDMFPDHLQRCRNTLKSEFKDKYQVKDENCFTGFDAYKQVINSGVDVVLLATPPHFRPAHLKAAVEAGKHIFCEKPVAVDAPGVRSVFETVELAKQKKLVLVSGLCCRYHNDWRETVAKIQDGAIGSPITMQATYNVGFLWNKKRQASWSDMEWQLRNWLYFTWLSGDHNVEQHVHSLDRIAWVLKDEYPVKCIGLGGRQVRTSTDFGNIFDHHACVYEYADGKRLYAYTRQQDKCENDVSDQFFGTKGTADIMKGTITDESRKNVVWRQKPNKEKPANMYQQEHDELFAAIRSGTPINNGDYMTKSTLMAIMGRMATYTGKSITWDMALNSKEDLTPPSYEMSALPMPPVARPGQTKFV